MKPKYALIWTWEKYRLPKTKKAASHAMGVWKRWYERSGWDVIGAQGKQMIATHPDGTQHAIVMHDLRSK